MQIGWKEVADHVGGELVAGTLIARINGKHEVLGQQRGTQFDFTVLGHEIARKLEQTQIKQAVKALKLRKPETEDAAAASDHVSISVEKAIDDLNLE